MAAIIPVVTTAGIQAALDAQGNGMQVEITELALGSGAFTPVGNETALVTEEQRVTIAGATSPTPGQLHLAALVAGAAEYWIQELGFFDSNGVLFAVWSDPVTPLGYKASAIDLIVAFDLVINAVDPAAITVTTTNNDPTLVFLAEQGVQDSRLTALEAAPGGTTPADEARITTLEGQVTILETSEAAQDLQLDDHETRISTIELAPPGGTTPADEARITVLETSQGVQDTDIGDHETRITTIEGLPPGGTTPADEARITALETSQGVQDGLIATAGATNTTQDTRLTALEANPFDPLRLPVTPNRFYATRRFGPFCGGVLNSQLLDSGGGVTAPYSFDVRAGVTAGATIEVVDVQDTARLSALGIPRTGAFLLLSVGGTTIDFHIVVIDCVATAAPVTGGFYHIALAAEEFLSNQGVQYNVSNNYVQGLQPYQAGAWINAMVVDPTFEMNIGGDFGGAKVTAADVGVGWQYKQGTGSPNPSPGIFARTTTSQPSGGTVRVAIALPYYGYGDHGSIPIWDKSVKDIIDGL